MAEKILMPRLSDTMTEGVIAAWHKNVGDAVKKGDLLAEIETDKATMELESYKDGVLLHRGGGDGAKLQVNDLLAIVGDKNEDVSALLNGNGAAKKDTADKQVEGVGNKENADNKQPGTTDTKTETGNTQPTANDVDISKMEEVVLMPRLSDTMTEGVIATWQKNVGDDVKKGDILAEIETDKATMELESYKDGKLLYQGAKQGDKIAVNDLLAIIGKDGFDVDKVVNAAKGGASPKQEIVAKDNADQQKAEGDVSKHETGDKSQESGEKKQTQPEQQVINEGRIFASPLAKKLAEEKGIDLKYVKGSGDNGRITKTDIDNFKTKETEVRSQESEDKSQETEIKPEQKPQAVTYSPSGAGGEDFEEVPVSQMRKAISKRVAESMFTAPHFYLTMTIDMDACVAARKKINDLSPVKISFNDLALKAVAVALKQHPKVNSSWLGDKIRINHHVNIGVAIAVEEGLLIPVVRFADTKPLSQIATEVKTFAQKAKDKKLQPADWEGSTFTISNLGMFGIDEFTAIINPPDACILAIGGIALIPVVKNGAVVPGNVMKVTLSCDHRVVDGATGAAFLQTVKNLLEEPLRMMV